MLKHVVNQSNLMFGCVHFSKQENQTEGGLQQRSRSSSQCRMGNLTFNLLLYFGVKSYNLTECNDINSTNHRWKREIRVKKMENRMKGETWYYTPCGRRMKQFPEIIKVLFY